MAKEPGYFTFIKNDGTSTSTSVTAKYDTITAPSISNIAGVDWTRSNYNFVEWNTDSNGTGASCSPGDTIDWDTYGVCYAIWEEKHEVTIYYKGSTIASMDASGTKTLNTEGTWVEDDISVEYDRPTAPTPVYQSKTVNPSTSQQTVSPDSGYDGLSSVTVNAMPSGTEGTPVATKTTSSTTTNYLPPMVDGTYSGNGVQAVVSGGVATLSGTTTASGNAIIIPLSKAVVVPDNSYFHLFNSVANGSASPSFELSTSAGTTNIAPSFNPANRIFPVPSNRFGVTIDRVRFWLSSGVTLSGTFNPMLAMSSTAIPFEPYGATNTIIVTPSVTNTAGYIAGGTKTGTAVSVSASELVSGTYNVSSIGTTDITNYKYISVPSGEATVTATKGTVSNHSVSITPSATISEGYMEDEIATGTAVTVSASELVSGTLSVSSSGTQDVTNYASVSVPSGSAIVPNKTYYPTASISVNDETGEIMAYGRSSYTLAPTVTAGYVSSGTSGTITVDMYGGYQLPIYEGEHHQPPILTISLTNPVNSSYFDSCEIYDETSGETKIGEITSATGSVSLDLTDRFAWWDVDTLYIWITHDYKSGGFIHVDPSGISCTGDVTYTGGSYGESFTVTGAGTIVIDGIDYNYGA